MSGKPIPEMVEKGRRAMSSRLLPTEDAGVFVERHWAHPLDAMAETLDPRTARPWIAGDAYDLGVQLGEDYLRAGIAKRSGMRFGREATGDVDQPVAAAAEKRWRDACKHIRKAAGAAGYSRPHWRVELVISVCCEAQWPSAPQARLVVRSLEALIEKKP